MLYSAFLMGLVGSLHCVGMCGPIALALPVKDRQWSTLLLSRVLYNLGRIVTYALLGSILALLGLGLAASRLQQGFSIGIGIFLLLSLVFYKLRWKLPFMERALYQSNAWLKRRFSFFIHKKSWASYFFVGMINGLLPCGLVYLALAGALALGSAWEPVWYMMLFGAGTFPVMLLTTFGAPYLKKQLAWGFQKNMLPTATVIMALWFIVRGLNLGLPYLSPRIYEGVNQQVQAECCHPATMPSKPNKASSTSSK